jgi:hypothetical protein
MAPTLHLDTRHTRKSFQQSNPTRLVNHFDKRMEQLYIVAGIALVDAIDRDAV